MTRTPGSPAGSPVASGSGWGGLAPPPPGMEAVGGAASGMVAARIAAFNAGTGAVASRAFSLFTRTTTVDVGTKTDDMVLGVARAPRSRIGSIEAFP